MLVEKGYPAATLSDRRCPVLSVVVGWDVAPMWPHELGRHSGRRGGPVLLGGRTRRSKPISVNRRAPAFCEFVWLAT
jgi:hypothetical protein